MSHTNIINTLHKAHSREMTKGNGVKAKDKARLFRGQSQGHNFLSSSCPRGRGQTSRTPSMHIEKYTVVHKKTCHFIFDHNSHVSWWIFTLVVPMETGINFLPRVCLLNGSSSVMTSYLRHIAHYERLLCK